VRRPFYLLDLRYSIGETEKQALAKGELYYIENSCRALTCRVMAARVN
jgi:hypothetical protein